LLLSACSVLLRRSLGLPADASAAGGTVDRQLTSGGVARHYLLHIPANYDPGTPIALVLNFHGYGSNSHQEENLTGMSGKADAAGFLVAYPDGLNKFWSDGPSPDGQRDLEFVRDTIGSLESQYNVDPKRIYATRISNGGGMTNRLGCSMADQFAAIAPDSGAYNFWQDCDPSRPMPVLAFHGLDDHLVPYTGGSASSMEPPIEAWAAAWGDRDGCASAPSVTTPVDTVTVRMWSSCHGNAEVVLYTVANHGHSWPGSPTMPRAITSQAVNATDVIWSFFQAHPMP
jgi:polyhydroxybutyrate depolymerase